MRIVFLLERYLPEKNAGIENYTHGLAKLLQSQGHHITILAMYGSGEMHYQYDGIDVNILNGRISSLENILESAGCDICHIQEYSGEEGINISWFEKAKKYCSKLFFTFHLPYLTCYKNDFRHHGISDCNNFSDHKRCTQCTVISKFHGGAVKGLIKTGLAVSYPLASSFPPLKRIAGRIKDNRQSLDKLVSICDAVFIYAGWFEKLLRENGVNMSNIYRIPYLEKIDGIHLKTDHTVRNKILFAGRIEPQKGLHLLCKAMKHTSVKGLSMDVFGNVVEQEYFDRCKTDHDFNYCGTLPLPELLKILPEYDFLVLPSQFTEMYSMMLRYAFQTGLPVIVSTAKGNKDVVNDGKNGFLFNYGDAQDLGNTLSRAYTMLGKGWRPDFTEIKENKEDISKLYILN